MRFKYILMAALGIILSVSILQIFPVWPSAGEIFPWYKSGYFSEIDRQYRTIADAFTGIMLTSKPEYAWFFLEDIEKSQKVSVRVYDSRGDYTRFPNEKTTGNDDIVLRLVRTMNPAEFSAVRGKIYTLYLPLRPDKRCSICHVKTDSSLTGVMVFEREYDGRIYYTAERKIIFSVISLLCVILLFIVFLWDPERRVKELFDK
jgi:hypothetical protein